MIYVMSDIHGEFEKYRRMLEVIDFSDRDTLYVLGDTVDRGPEPISVLLDMMKRPNVYPIIGNHEVLMQVVLRRLMREIDEESIHSVLTSETMTLLSDWKTDGGDVTLDSFRALSREEQEDVLEYIDEFSAYETVRTSAGRFILVHAGLGNFSPERGLDDYTLEELAFMRPDYERRYFEDGTYVVCGHTPTPLIWGQNEIYRRCGNIAIDCGAAFGGRLACLCLDDLSEYYV